MQQKAEPLNEHSNTVKNSGQGGEETPWLSHLKRVLFAKEDGKVSPE